MSDVEASILVCTRDRCSRLSKMLASLASMDPVTDTFEVVVVDNGSSDETRRVVDEFAQAVSFPVRYAFESRPGLSFARNHALKLSQGRVLLFTDDDCIVGRDWLKAALALHREDGHRMVGGRVELFNPDEPTDVVRTSLVEEKLTSTARLFGFLHGANMVVARSVVEAVGLFDVRLGAGTRLRSAEDTDFVYRVYSKGIPVVYRPQLVVFHDHGRTDRRLALRQSRGYSVGTGALMLKHVVSGRGDLVRPVYWQIAGLGAARRRQGTLQAVRLLLSYLTGMSRYAMVERRRPQY